MSSKGLDPSFGTALPLNAGYRVTLADGKQVYYPPSVLVATVQTKKGSYVTVNGHNAQDIYQTKRVSAVELRNDVSGSYSAYTARARRPSYISGNCDASQSSCPVCPDCSGPDAGPGGETDQLNCEYLGQCGYDPFGYHGRIWFGILGQFLPQSSDALNCLWDAEAGNLDCIFSAAMSWDFPQFFSSDYYYYYPNDFQRSCAFQVYLPPVHNRYLTFAGYKDNDTNDARGRVYFVAKNGTDLQTWERCNPNSTVSNLYYDGLWLAGGAGAVGAQRLF